MASQFYQSASALQQLGESCAFCWHGIYVHIICGVGWAGTTVIRQGLVTNRALNQVSFYFALGVSDMFAGFGCRHCQCQPQDRSATSTLLFSCHLCGNMHLYAGSQHL